MSAEYRDPDSSPRERKTPRRGQNDSRATIAVTTVEYEVTGRSIAELAKHPKLYQRGGKLVQAVTNARAVSRYKRPEGGSHIGPVEPPLVREMLSEMVFYVHHRPEETVAVHVPDWVVKQVVARGQWETVRPLELISETPLLRPDGSVVSAPGYDADTGVLFIPNHTFPVIPNKPTAADVKAAIAVILEPFLDFPFEQECNRSAAVAGVLTPLAKLACGPAPLFLISKNLRGAGGTLLAQTIGLAASGRPMGIMTQAKEEDEERKRILSIALAGDRMVLIDNIKRPLGGENLDACLTGTEWKDRRLGKSETVSAPLHATWYATGNNPELQGDTVRRVLPIRLVSSEEKPEERRGFRHENLEQFVKGEHPRIVSAALTILRAHANAGRPGMGLSAWGSFQEWSDTVRAALVWAGLPDPALGRAKVEEASDTETGALKTIYENWQEVDRLGTGLTAGNLLNQVFGHQLDEPIEAIRDAMLMLFAGPDGKLPNAVSLSLKLNRFTERTVSGKRLSFYKGRANQKVWTIKAV